MPYTLRVLHRFPRRAQDWTKKAEELPPFCVPYEPSTAFRLNYTQVCPAGEHSYPLPNSLTKIPRYPVFHVFPSNRAVWRCVADDDRLPGTNLSLVRLISNVSHGTWSNARQPCFFHSIPFRFHSARWKTTMTRAAMRDPGPSSRQAIFCRDDLRCQDCRRRSLRLDVILRLPLS